VGASPISTGLWTARLLTALSHLLRYDAYSFTCFALPSPEHHLLQVAQLFRLLPETVARRVLKEWHAAHPKWTKTELREVRTFLLDVYRQVWVWWDEHPHASHAQVRAADQRVVKTSLRDGSQQG
jgi:hypothetical protein